MVFCLMSHNETFAQDARSVSHARGSRRDRAWEIGKILMKRILIFPLMPFFLSFCFKVVGMNILCTSSNEMRNNDEIL